MVMSPINPEHDFIVEMKRTEAFGWAGYSAATQDEAFKMAVSMLDYDDPEEIRVVTKESDLVFDQATIEAAVEKEHVRLGITTQTFIVKVGFDLLSGNMHIAEVQEL